MLFADHSMRQRILVADDSTTMRKIVCLMLEKVGYVTEYAADGAEGIEKLRAGHFDGVVLDLVMPRGGGLAVLDYIVREKPQLLPTTVVLTAYPAIAMREQLHNACEVLEKPRELSRLIAALQRANRVPSETAPGANGERSLP